MTKRGKTGGRCDKDCDKWQIGHEKGLTGKPASPLFPVVGATGFEPVTSTV